MAASKSRSPAQVSGPKNTALQAHAEFFDPDCDGIIWPSDTYVLSFSLAAIRLYVYSWLMITDILVFDPSSLV